MKRDESMPVFGSKSGIAGGVGANPFSGCRRDTGQVEKKVRIARRASLGRS